MNRSCYGYHWQACCPSTDWSHWKPSLASRWGGLVDGSLSPNLCSSWILFWLVLVESWDCLLPRQMILPFAHRIAAWQSLDHYCLSLWKSHPRHHQQPTNRWSLAKLGLCNQATSCTGLTNWWSDSARLPCPSSTAVCAEMSWLRIRTRRCPCALVQRHFYARSFLRSFDGWGEILRAWPQCLHLYSLYGLSFPIYQLIIRMDWSLESSTTVEICRTLNHGCSSEAAAVS